MLTVLSPVAQRERVKTVFPATAVASLFVDTRNEQAGHSRNAWPAPNAGTDAMDCYCVVIGVRVVRLVRVFTSLVGMP